MCFTILGLRKIINFLEYLQGPDRPCLWQDGKGTVPGSAVSSQFQQLDILILIMLILQGPDRPCLWQDGKGALPWSAVSPLVQQLRNNLNIAYFTRARQTLSLERRKRSSSHSIHCVIILILFFKGQTDLVSGKTEKELFLDLQYPL